MEFKKLVAGHNSYGISDPFSDPMKVEVEGVTNVNFADPYFFTHMNNESHPNYENI